jgi:hypothetical protein
MVHEFRNRALKKFCLFVFVDAMYTSVKAETGTGQKALYKIVVWKQALNQLVVLYGDSVSRHIRF